MSISKQTVIKEAEAKATNSPVATHLRLCNTPVLYKSQA